VADLFRRFSAIGSCRCLSLVTRARLELQKNKSVEQLCKNLLSDPKCLVNVAFLGGEPVGAAIWHLKSGTARPHPLQKYIRTLALRERLHKISMQLSNLGKTYLPMGLRSLLWPGNVGNPAVVRRYRRVSHARVAAYEKWFPTAHEESDYVVLHSMCILPEHQRKGIGSALLRQGMRIAQNKEVLVYVMASQAGKQLYLRHDFGILERMIVKGVNIVWNAVEASLFVQKK
jgi:ribosomal protein S18 acetylase RimI-like enzyme